MNDTLESKGTDTLRGLESFVKAVESGSIAATAGLSAGQEIVSIDGEPTSGWAAVNLQLVRRLGESGSVQVLVRDEGSSADSPKELILDNWLKGADEPDPIRSLGIRPWRPALPPVLAELDPKGPARAAGLQTGDRLLALDGQALTDWQQVVDWVRVRPETKVLADDWTAVTRDKSLSAQFEHSVGVTATGCEIFTLSPAGKFHPTW